MSPEDPVKIDPGSEAPTIAQQAGRGLRWSLVASFSTKIGSLAMGLVLARLLAPADFGTYAIALAATGFMIHVNDVGLMAATVQWRGKLSEVAATASTLALVFSLAVYGLFWFGAPAFAELAGNPDAAPVVRLLALIIVVDGITAVRVAALQRTFRQHKIAIANMVGFVVQAPVAIVLATGGMGAYAFVVAQVAQSVVTGILLFRWAGLPLEVRIDRAVARKLLRYGIPLAGSLGVEALLINADYVIVGRIMGATVLGFYLLAFNVSSWVANTLGTAIRYVSVAGFSRLSEQEGELSAGVKRAIQLLLTAVLPIIAVMSVLAEPLISFLYGDRWAPAASALTLLMVLAMIRLLSGLSLDALMGAGTTKAALWVNLGWAAVLIPALIIGTRIDGIRGTAMAHVVVGLLVALPLSAIALQRAGVRLAPIGVLAIHPLLAAVLGGATTALVAHFVTAPLFLELAAAGTAGLLVYVLTAFRPEQLRQASEKVLRKVRPQRGAVEPAHQT